MAVQHTSASGTWIAAALLAAVAAVGGFLWRPDSAPQRTAPPTVPPAAANPVQAARLAAPDDGQREAPAVPQVPMAPRGAGEDPLAAAVSVVNAMPRSIAPPAIAQAQSLEEAFAAMRAANAEAAPASIAASPFGTR